MLSHPLIDARETTRLHAAGATVQEAFAMDPEQARSAPPGLVTKLNGGRHTYHVYVHRCEVWREST
jgi:hypothetical protein